MIHVFRAAFLLLCLCVQVQAEPYKLKPGDTLRLEVVEDPSLDRTVLIPPDGLLSVPLAGSIRAGGRTVEQVRMALINGWKEYFAYVPSVFVSIASVQPLEKSVLARKAMNVYVMGEVGKPGRIEVAPGTTVLQALSVAGGFSPFAATKRIQLRRQIDGRERIYPLNYDAIESGVSPNGSVVLMDGDTFVVPVRRLFE